MKQPIKKVLLEAISSLEQLGNEKLGKQFPIATLFIERAKNVIKLADTWIKHQTPARLKDIVEGVHRLGQIRELQTLLNAIPNRAMCPSSRKNLLTSSARSRDTGKLLDSCTAQPKGFNWYDKRSLYLSVYLKRLLCR